MSVVAVVAVKDTVRPKGVEAADARDMAAVFQFSDSSTGGKY
jgi:hypothetical protein